MVQISAQLVKELREKTGAGMMDCKKALVETNGDIKLAVDYLRERGIAQAAKKSSRVAAEGLCKVVIQENNGLVFELNSETDFVAKNKDFLELLDKIGEILIKSNVSDVNEALKLKIGKETLESILTNATAKIGEKLSLRRINRITKDKNQGFGAYAHMGGKIVTLVLLEKDDEILGKDLAMHIAANNPKYLNSQSVDSQTIEHEKQILTNQALQEGKPANIVEKMITGRLNKYLKEICLVDQPFLKNQDITVLKHLKDKNNNVISYIRLEVGEGIEKIEEDFAAEVAAVTKGK